MQSKFIFRNKKNNYISSSIEFNDNKKISIIKSTFDKNSLNELENEYKGYSWYSQFNPISLKLKKNDNFNYMQLDIEYVNGIKANYRKGLTKNYNKVLSIINYYNKITKKNYSISKKYPLHGDLSIDNIIFKNDEILIIDWQYFTLLDNNFGFDILNLVFEQLYFDLTNFNIFKSNQKILKKLINLLKYAFDNSMIDMGYKKNPLKKIREYIKANNEIIWKNQSYKLPVTKFNNMQVSFIDNYVKMHIN